MNQNITPTVRNILFINIAIFVIQKLELFPIDFANQFGLHHIDSPLFRPYQIITHMFVHGSLGHIFFNMFALFSFGTTLESLWGAKRFLIFYMFCGLGAGLLQSAINYIEIKQLADITNIYLENPTPLSFEAILNKLNPDLLVLNGDFINSFSDNPTNAQMIAETKQLVQNFYEGKRDSSMVGASGAIFGLLAAFALIFPNLELQLLFPPIPMKAKYMIGIYMLIEIYRAIANRPDDNIAHFAHLGGALFGYIMLQIWHGNNYRRY